MQKEGKRGGNVIEVVLSERDQLLEDAVAEIDAVSEISEWERTAKDDRKKELRRDGETIRAQALKQAAIQSSPGSQCTSTWNCKPTENDSVSEEPDWFRGEIISLKKTDYKKLRLEESRVEQEKALCEKE